MNSSPVKVKEKVESRLMSEMRQHLVEMNRKKMLDRGLISERELAIIGQLTFKNDRSVRSNPVCPITVPLKKIYRPKLIPLVKIFLPLVLLTP